MGEFLLGLCIEATVMLELFNKVEKLFLNSFFNNNNNNNGIVLIASLNVRMFRVDKSSPV